MNNAAKLPCSEPRAAARSWIAIVDLPDERDEVKAVPIDLTDAEIEHIRLEEKCRMVIREELAGESEPAGSRFWKLLNSAFVLWLLSVVVASAAGSFYAKWSETRAAERKRLAACETLELEIGYRISHALVSLHRAQRAYELDTRNEAKSPDEALRGRKQRTAAAVRRLYFAPADSFRPLYPEYAKFGLPALVAELRRNQRDETLRGELTEVLRNITADSTDEPIELTPPDWTRRIMEKYVLARWTRAFVVKDPFGQ